MKKIKVKTVLTAILIIIVAVVIIGTISNSITSKKKMKEYADAYGKFAETSSGRINYTVYGNSGQTIVLLPGFGSVSPHFEFNELALKLSDEYKVITVEPLGYGLSDYTDSERTSDAICNEIHEVLSEIGEDSYYLMGHSISGVYALNYSNKYTDEVLGFIGIDASVPEQINDSNPADQMTVQKIYRLLMIDTGFLRATISSIPNQPDDYFRNEQFYGSTYSAMASLSKEEREVYSELMIQKTANKTVMNEINSLKDSCLQEMEYKFPDTVPVLYILSNDTISQNENWVSYHEKLVSNNAKGKVLSMDGTHYLHLCNASELCSTAKEWLKEVK